MKTEIDYEEALKASSISKKTKVKREGIYNYETVISSGCDFAIRRYNDTTSKILIAFLSQDMFCILDERTNEKNTINEPRNVSQFFFDLHPEDVVLKKGTASFIKNNVKKKDFCDLFKVLLDAKDTPALKHVLKKGIFNPFKYFMNNNRKDTTKENLVSLYELSPVLCIYILTNSLSTIPDVFELNFIRSCYNSFGLDITKEIYSVGLHPKFVLNMEVDFTLYNLDGQRFARYVKTNFFSGYHATMDLYVDYLALAKAKDKIIKEKYPKYLISAHDKMKAELDEEQLLKKSFPEFEGVIADSRDYTYENELDEFSIVMPKTASDLVVEGMTLGHCVSVYAPKVIAGDCMIVFMREKDAKDTPYLTMEIVKDKYITEIEGANKRTGLTDKEIVFIKSFAKVFDLEITAQNALRPVVRKNVA